MEQHDHEADDWSTADINRGVLLVGCIRRVGIESAVRSIGKGARSRDICMAGYESGRLMERSIGRGARSSETDYVGCIGWG